MSPFPYTFGDIFWFSSIPAGFTPTPQPGGSFSLAVALGTPGGTYTLGWTVQDSFGVRTFGSIPITVIGAPVVPPPAGAIELGSSYTYPTRITPSFNGHIFTGPGSFWAEMNRTVVGDLVDPDSAAMIAGIGGRDIHIDFFGGSVGLESTYGIPINVVSGTQPRVQVIVGSYAGESDDVLVPIPANPSIEGWKGPGLPTQAQVNDGGDHHMLIAVRDEATGGIGELFEMYQTWNDALGWHSASLSYWNMANGLPRPDGWTSGDAAGLPMIPLMATYGEVHQVGGIKHPLRVTFSEGNTRNRYIWPGRHAALNGSATTGIPFGARLRLSSAWYSAHAAEYTGEARVFIEAFRQYGVINADIGGMGFLCGISDDRFDNNNLMTLQNVPWTAFEVVKMTPQFDLVGPLTISLGQTVSYSTRVNPDPEPNGVHGYYLHSFEQGPGGTWVNIEDTGGVGIQPHRLGLDNGIVNFNFTFTPRITGPHLFEVDQAGEYKLEGVTPTQPIPGRGPFAYWTINVN